MSDSNKDTRKSSKRKTPAPPAVAQPEEAKEKKATISVRMAVAAPNLNPWLQVTSKKTGYKIFVPLPIRLIQQIPDTEGGGCIVRGAYGDDCTTTENVIEILDRLSGYPLKSATVWSLAGGEAWEASK